MASAPIYSKDPLWSIIFFPILLCSVLISVAVGRVKDQSIPMDLRNKQISLLFYKCWLNRDISNLSFGEDPWEQLPAFFPQPRKNIAITLSFKYWTRPSPASNQSVNSTATNTWAYQNYLSQLQYQSCNNPSPPIHLTPSRSISSRAQSTVPFPQYSYTTRKMK